MIGSRGGRIPPITIAMWRHLVADFASISGVPETWVGAGSQVSGFVGLVAGSIPAGSVVVCPEGEFTSVLFPFLVQSGRDGDRSHGSL